MNPCDFTAGGLEAVLVDPQLVDMARQRMTPDAMRTLATRLDEARHSERYRASDVLDPVDYLQKASYFLTFWADLGFGVLPIELDDLIDFGSSEDAVAVTTEGDTAEPTTIH